jgi:NAD(P)-dependent dehydrogenase (short-subunit alcohol dehydrogenase family)
MDLQLQDKRALITGSTSGIGFAAAVALAREGAHVLLNGRSARRVEDACKRLLVVVPEAQVSGTAADLSTADGVQALVSACPDIDILVNNLGIFEPKAFDDIGDTDWQRMFDVNVMSGVRLARAYLPAMKQRNWGRIVFVSSESGANIPAEMVHYGMSKSAQLAVSRGIAEVTAGTGVTCNAVLPGPTMTEGVGEFFASLAAGQGVDLVEAQRRFFADARPSSLLKRFIDPAEVASLITYVCSPLSAATNGAALRVDGGIVRSIV